VPANCSQQPELVEDRGSKGVDDAAQVAQRRGEVVADIIEELDHLGLVAADELGAGVDPGRGSGQDRAQPVVKVPAQAPALLLGGTDDPASRVPQPPSEGDHVRGDRGLTGDLGEEVGLTRCQGGLPGPARDHQVADHTPRWVIGKRSTGPPTSPR
jgi:hypothetical protein